MTHPTIRAALEVMARQLCDDVSHSGGVYDALPDGPACMGLLETKADWRLLAARNIATFLRHFRRGANLHSFTLPDAWGSPFAITIETQRLDALAAAVQQAAKELPHD